MIALSTVKQLQGDSGVEMSEFRWWDVKKDMLRIILLFLTGFVSLVNAGATDIGEGTGWRQGRWDEFVGIEKKYFQPSYIS